MKLIVCFVNRKGGCSKTGLSYFGSTAIAAGADGGDGGKVLVGDLDSQSSLSQILFGPKWVEALPKRYSVAALFDPKYDPVPEQLIHPTSIPNLSLLPSSNDLTEHNLPIGATVGATDLAAFLREIREEYAHIILDCPPNLQFCSYSALMASDFVVVPAIPESPSTQGLIYVQRAIRAAQTGGNARLRLLGYLLTMYNRQLGIQRTFEAGLRDTYGTLVFENIMPLATAYKESIARSTPISVTAPRSAAAKAIQSIVAEILDRANGVEPRTMEARHGQGGHTGEATGE